MRAIIGFGLSPLISTVGIKRSLGLVVQVLKIDLHLVLDANVTGPL